MDSPPDRPSEERNATPARGVGAREGPEDAIDVLVAATADAVEGAESFSTDDLFETLADPGCRYVLTSLLQSDGFVTCSELVDYVVDRSDHTMTDGEFRRRVTAEITHTHLPKLEEKGLVQYNMERGIAAPTDLTPVVRPYLQLALAHQDVADRTDRDGES